VRGDAPARALVAWDRLAGTGTGETWQGVVERLVCGPPRRISIDVFDTVLSRRVVGDESIFWITGTALVAEGSWTGTVADFVDARLDAARARPERDAGAALRRAPPRRTLPVWGRPTGRGRCGAPARAAGRGLRGGAPATPRRRSPPRLRLGHAPVRPQLLACLVSVGLEVAADDLVISSEVGASKWDGTLFPLLRAGGAPVDFHIGNDLWSDVAMAERAGGAGRAAQGGRADRARGAHGRAAGLGGCRHRRGSEGRSLERRPV
jgi:hypothetical protein